MKTDKEIADEVAVSISEGILVIPMGAGIHALSGWVGVLMFSIGWILWALIRGWRAHRRSVAA